MDQTQLQYLFRQGQASEGFQVANENIMLVPYAADGGLQVASAYVATIRDAEGRHCTFVLGYSTKQHTEAARQPDCDRFFVQMGHPLLEAEYDRDKAAMRCLQATRRAMVPQFPLSGRFQQLKDEYDRTGRAVTAMKDKFEAEGDFLDCSDAMLELETMLGMMKLRATNLQQNRNLKDVDSQKHAAERLVDAMMRNYACYPLATVEPFMATPSNPLVNHPHIQHGLSTVATSRVVLELKRRHRQAHAYLSTGVVQA